VPLSSDHTICPGCKNAIGKKFLARCGGLCTGCQRKAHPFEDYRTRAHADKRKQPMKLLLQQEE
jgi:predicted amidophosphoribosyltransferase